MNDISIKGEFPHSPEPQLGHHRFFCCENKILMMIIVYSQLQMSLGLYDKFDLKRNLCLKRSRDLNKFSPYHPPQPTKHPLKQPQQLSFANIFGLDHDLLIWICSLLVAKCNSNTFCIWSSRDKHNTWRNRRS